MDPQVAFSTQPGPFWEWRVAADLFLGGAGVGAFLTAVGLHSFFAGRYRKIVQTAAWLAPLLVGLGLALLLTHLGRPASLWLTFTCFAPTSPLWWGGIFQTLFVLGSLWYAAQWRSEDAPVPKRTVGFVVAPIAVIVGAYHGLLLAIINARPLWNTGPTVVAALLAFIATGVGAVMLVHLLRMKFAGRLVEGQHLDNFLSDMQPVRTLLGASLVLQLVTFFFWWISLNFGDLQDQLALEAANAGFGTMFWAGGIGIGVLLPLVIGGLATLRGPRLRQSLQVDAILLSSVLILVGGFCFRLAVVLAGQAVLSAPTLS